MKPIGSAPVFRVFEIPSALAATSGLRIFKSNEILSARQREEEVHNAREEACAIIADAHAHAAMLIQTAAMQADEAYRARLDSVESEVVDRLDRVAAQLGHAVAASVESIFRSIFHSDPTLLINATIEIARHVLETEVGSVLHVNPADREDATIKALEKRFSVQANQTVESGVLHIRGENGLIKVDALKLIRELGQDLRQSLAPVVQTDRNQTRRP